MVIVLLNYQPFGRNQKLPHEKLVVICSAIVLLTSCSADQLLVSIPANQTVELDYSSYELYSANLKNKSMQGLEVAVLSKDNNDQVRGFGLGMKANADVIVEQGNRLVLKNSSDKTIKMGIEIEEKQPEVQRSADAYVSFTLRNNSVSSIPLIIPTVMNPNLSPMSNSGVDLKMGQEILFKANGKKHVLLTVDNSIQDGEIIEVASLLEERKVELGLK